MTIDLPWSHKIVLSASDPVASFKGSSNSILDPVIHIKFGAIFPPDSVVSTKSGRSSVNKDPKSLGVKENPSHPKHPSSIMSFSDPQLPSSMENPPASSANSQLRCRPSVRHIQQIFMPPTGLAKT
ncbi:hypothetical protein ACLOJK_036715 [Asimina triloba]